MLNEGGNYLKSQRVTPRDGVFWGAPGIREQDKIGSLILDNEGIIVRCSNVTAKIFETSRLFLEGASISSFLPSLLHFHSSPSYNARYLAHLCSANQWHCFEAINVHGLRFNIEITMSRIESDASNYRLLNLRQARPDRWHS